jgi:O-antigen ligase
VTRAVVALVTVALVGVATFYTKSRGGQLVFVAVLAVYFVRLVGVRRGLAVALLLALPILLLGGRGGEDAEASTMERTQCWWVGLHLLQQRPLFGVGFGEFLEHHVQTAHNSYVLTAAELGLPGMLLWTSILYVSVKIAVAALGTRGAPVGRSWAVAVLSSIAGILVGSAFLSYAYKTLLWMYVGVSGVLYQAHARHDPSFDVRFGLRDLVAVAAIDVALLLAHVAYTASKLGW